MASFQSIAVYHFPTEAVCVWCPQAVIHCEIVRQAARVVAMDCEHLRSGDRACVRFRFLQRPEYLTAGTRFVFREGRTKGIGQVVRPE